MKAVRTLPSWKRADSLFLCLLLTALVLRSTTPCPSLSHERTSAPAQLKPRRSTPILLSWCVVLRSTHVVQRIFPRSLKIHVRRFRNTPTPRTKYRTTNERIPLFLPAFPSAPSPHVSIQQRPIIPSGLWGADACGEVRRGLLEGGEDVALDAWHSSFFGNLRRPYFHPAPSLLFTACLRFSKMCEPLR